MSQTQARIVFAGTPAFAATHLQQLIAADCNIVGVYTQPDRPAGRKKKLQASPVKQLAQQHGIAVFQPENFKQISDIDTLKSLQPDILVVVAYGLILPQQVLDIATIAPINVHASLLPRWRGAAPIERAIAAGDGTTGVGIMRMEAGLDTGPILAEASIAIGANTSGDELRSQLADIGCELLLNTLSALSTDKNTVSRQQALDGVCYAHKLKRTESDIDWQLDAQSIHNKVRAFNSSNVATFTIAGTRVKLWRTHIVDRDHTATAGQIISTRDKTIIVACGSGCIALETLQMPGGRALACRDILNGHSTLFSQGAQLS